MPDTRSAAPLSYSEGHSQDRVACALVVCVWLAFSAATIAALLRYGAPIPVRDDWSVVPFLLHDSISFADLWEPANVHRVPAQKLAMWGLWRLGHGDVRYGMLCAAVPFTILGVVLPFQVRRIRGSMQFEDTLFPLALLNLGHLETLAWFTTLEVPYFAGIVCIASVFFALPRSHQGSKASLALGACLAILPLLGGPGAISAIPIAVTLLALGIVETRSGTSRIAGSIQTGAAALTLTVAAGIILSMPMADKGAAATLRPDRLIVGTLQYLAMAWGPVARHTWPLSGALVAIVALSTAGLLVRAMIVKSAGQRIAPLGLLSGLLSVALVGLAIAYGRDRQGGLVDRYSSYAIPFLLVTYVAWVSFAPIRIGPWFNRCLFFSVCAASLYNSAEGLRGLRATQANWWALQDDIAAGKPETAIVARHSPAWQRQEAMFRAGIQALRHANIRPWRDVPDDPAFASRDIRVDSVKFDGYERSEGEWRGAGRGSAVVIDLSGMDHVYALKLNLRIRTPRESTQVAYRWTGPAVDALLPVRSTVVDLAFNSAKDRDFEEHTFWIDASASRIAISFSEQPHSIEIDRVETLVRSAPQH